MPLPVESVNEAAFAELYITRVRERRALLEADNAHLDDAALRLLVGAALASSPHVQCAFLEWCAAGHGSREESLEMLALHQVNAQLEREFAAAGPREASLDARIDRACGGRA